MVWPFPTGQPGASCFGAGEVIKWFNPVLTCQVLQARWGSRVPHVKEGEGRSGFEEGLFKQPFYFARAVSFMTLKSSFLMPARFRPTPFPLCQLLLLSPFIHFTFFGGLQGSQLIIAHGVGDAEVVLLWGECASLPTTLAGRESSRPSSELDSKVRAWRLPSPRACGHSLPAWSASFRWL